MFNKIKSLYNTAKLAVLSFVSTVCNKAVAMLQKSEEKEVKVVIAGTEEVVDEVNTTIENSIATIANVVITIGVAIATYFVVMNLPITILFVMECVAVYKTITWTVNWLAQQA